MGITQGDSNGIGYEVIIKSLADERILDSFTPVIYGSSKIFGFYRKASTTSTRWTRTSSAQRTSSSGRSTW